MTGVQPIPLIVGHRGASGYRPEHTRAAYSEAFRRGADAVEPDLVVSRDGVLVIRHENDISGTTDIADHPEFSDRRTTKLIDGVAKTGWFTEDFDWAELRTLCARERRPRIRPANTAYDTEPLMCFPELITLVEQESDVAGRPFGLVAELKHASYFDSIGLPMRELYGEALSEAGWSHSAQLTTESFESTILAQLRDRRVGGELVYLLEASGYPIDRVIELGAEAKGYEYDMSDDGLRELASVVSGISVDKSVLVSEGGDAETSITARAHALGLTVLTWTLRPENEYLSPAYTCGTTGFGDWQGEFAAIMRSGVDGVFADHPDLALEVRKELFGR